MLHVPPAGRKERKNCVTAATDKCCLLLVTRPGRDAIAFTSPLAFYTYKSCFCNQLLPLTTLWPYRPVRPQHNNRRA